jgi:hypothetical protein
MAAVGCTIPLGIGLGNLIDAAVGKNLQILVDELSGVLTGSDW